MNVFILNTGRCGSSTFIKACQHISNFTSAHESRCNVLGEEHFDYPHNHIEADNRLSWFLGRLDRHYGNDAIYVHLKRNLTDTARSFVNRYSFGIIKSYRECIYMNLPKQTNPMSVAMDYCDTVDSNIDLFLKDKTHKMVFNLDTAKQDFQHFWQLIDAEGDRDAALSEFDTFYNATRKNTQRKKKIKRPQFITRILQKT
jgi:hypothetical protein